jgi:tetratricopeptide (TPR) repeat protein
MRIRTFLGAFVAFSLVSSSVLAATAEDWQDCTTPKNMFRDFDHRITACTHVIGDRTVSAAIYALAYHNRGIAYVHKKNYDRAIADFNEAIRRDAAYAHPYVGRGTVYEFLSRKADAIADYRKTLLFDPADKFTAEALKRLDAKPF